MDITIYYKGASISLQDFCNQMELSYEDVINEITYISKKVNITLEQAVTVIFPFMYVNVFGHLIMNTD